LPGDKVVFVEEVAKRPPSAEETSLIDSAILALSSESDLAAVRTDGEFVGFALRQPVYRF